MTIEREKLFGDDLMVVDRAGGLDLLGDWAGDISLAHGNDNIVQALKLRMMVRRGELAPLGWPNYGSRIHELIGEPNNSRTHVILMAHARNAIEQDPRVAEVIEVRTEASERSVATVFVEIRLINQQNPINLVFPVELGAI